METNTFEILKEKEETELDWEVTNYQTDISSDFIFPFLAFNALRATDLSGVHNINSQFGLFSGLSFDPAGGSSGSQVDLFLGVSGQVNYTYARFFSIALFGNTDFVEPEEHAHHEGEDNSFDYRLGGKVSLFTDLTPNIFVFTGYTMFYRRQVANHPEDISHYYWTGGVYVGMRFNNLNRRGLDSTGGYALNITFSVYDEIFGSKYNFKTLDFNFRYYVSLYEDHILKLELDANIGHENVPFFYDLGGSNNLRGISTNDFKGSERWVATAEYRFPLYRDLNHSNMFIFGLIKDIRAFVFFETGSVSTRIISHFKNFNDMDVKYTVGGGIRIDYYFLQTFPLPLVVQVGKEIDNDRKPIYYIGINRNF